LTDETQKPFINSGHAFVCFDTVNSLNAVVKHFKITPMQHIKIFLIGIKDKFKDCWQYFTGKDDQHEPLFDGRGRARSNFLRATDAADFMEIDYTDTNSILVTRKASEPLDILWKNMGVITTHFQFMRFFLVIIGFVLIIFLSSPAVILSKV
jgi:hypothetical protein